MSANIVFGGNVSYKGQSFPRLTMKHYGELEQALRDYRRASYRAALDQQNGLQPPDRARLMGDFEAKPLLWMEVDDWLQTGEGARRAVQIVGRIEGKNEADAAAFADSLSIVDAQYIARVAMGTVEVRATDPLPAT